MMILLPKNLRMNGLTNKELITHKEMEDFEETRTTIDSENWHQFNERISDQ